MSKFVKFLILGAVSTLVDYSIFSLLYVFEVQYAIAIIFSYSGGLIVNFYAGRKLIFISGSKLKTTHFEFISVTLIALVGLLINIAFVKMLSFSMFEIDPRISRIGAIGVAFIWNYFARKLFVYH